MIGWQLNPYAAILTVCALFSGAMAVYSWRRRPATGAAPLALFLLAATEWSLAYALELGSPALGAKIFWARVQYFGIVSVAVLMLLMVLEYTGWQRWLTPGRAILLAVVPVLGLLLVWTNDTHSLIWPGLRLDATGRIPMLVVDHGPFFWIIVAYSYLCLTAGTTLLHRYMRHAAPPYRTHAGLMIVSTLVPWFGNVLYIAGLNPQPGLDLTPFFFTVAGLAATWAVFGLQLLDLVPIAHDLIFENMSDGVLVVDARGRVVSANAAALDILGRAGQTLVGQPAAQFLARWPDLIDRFRSVEETDAEIVLGAGQEQRYYDLHISPLRHQGRGLLGRVAVAHDTSALKETERALLLHQQQLEAQETALNKLLALSRLLATTHDLSAALGQVVDNALHIVAGADACTVQWLAADGETLETLASSREEGRIREPVRFRLGEGIAGHALMEQRLINVPDVLDDPRFVPGDQPRTFRSLLVAPLVAKSHSLGTLSLSSSTVAGFSPTDETLAGLMADQIAAVLENANLLAQLQENVVELQARNEELDAFSHTVAHDLKSPVTSVIGYADLLARHRHRMEPAMIDEFLDNIYFQGQKMNDIISALLLLARVSAAERFDKDILDMKRIVEDALTRLRPLIQEHSGHIQLPETWPAALGYGPWVEAVWVNFISNALKYGGRPPCVELGAALEPDGSPRFWVRDNGNGLNPTEQRRVFTPFERLHRTDATGHGLGLSIVQRIVTALDGRVGVESSGLPGQGSTFYFTLPAVDGERET